MTHVCHEMLSRSGYVLRQDSEELRGVPFFVTTSFGATSNFAGALIIGKLAIAARRAEKIANEAAQGLFQTKCSSEALCPHRRYHQRKLSLRLAIDNELRPSFFPTSVVKQPRSFENHPSSIPGAAE